MIVLWIILALIGLILLLLATLLFVFSIKVIIVGNNEEIARVTVTLLGYKVLSVGVFDEPEPEPRVRISDYTPKKIEKRRLARLRAEAARRIREAKPKSKEPEPGPLYTLKFVINLLAVLYDKYSTHLRVKVATMNIKVASGSPDKTAVLYGIVIQSANYLIEFLDNVTRLHAPKIENINIYPDFLAGNSDVDIKIILKLRTFRVLGLLYESGLRSLDDLDKLTK